MLVCYGNQLSLMLHKQFTLHWFHPFPVSRGDGQNGGIHSFFCFFFFPLWHFAALINRKKK